MAVQESLIIMTLMLVTIPWVGAVDLVKRWEERLGDQDRGPAARAFQTRAGGSLRFGAQALKSASPHPCPDESGQRVPGGLAARSPFRPFLLPSSRDSSCASCAGAPRTPRRRAGARGVLVLQVGAAPRPERAGLPRERGSRDSAPAVLPRQPRDLELGPDLGSGTDGGASAVRPRGTGLPAALGGLPCAPSRPVPAAWTPTTSAHFCQGGWLPGAQSHAGSRPRCPPPPASQCSGVRPLWDDRGGARWEVRRPEA